MPKHVISAGAITEEMGKVSDIRGLSSVSVWSVYCMPVGGWY